MLDLAGNSLLGVVWCNRRCNSDLQPVQSAAVTASALCICCAAVYVASLADCSGHSTPPAVQPAVHPLSLVAVMQRAPPPTFHFTAFEATIKSACETAHSVCSCALCHTGCETRTGCQECLKCRVHLPHTSLGGSEATMCSLKATNCVLQCSLCCLIEHWIAHCWLHKCALHSLQSTLHKSYFYCNSL